MTKRKIKELEKEIEWLERAEIEWFKEAVERDAHIRRLEGAVSILFNKWSYVVESNKRLRKRIKKMEAEYSKLRDISEELKSELIKGNIVDKKIKFH